MASTRARDTNGSIVRSVTLVQNGLNTETGGQKLRIDTYNGAPDITFVRLTKTNAVIESKGAYVREMIERGRSDQGHIASNKIYLAYYDGSSTWACGGGSYPPTLIGPLVAIYLQGLPGTPVPCNSNVLGSATAVKPGYLDIAMLHEFIHGLGVPATCAPHQHSQGHTSDSPTDLMWQGAAAWDTANMHVDVGHDDYFQQNIIGCPDLKNSAFMSNTVGATWLPSGWGSTPQSARPEFG